MGRQKPINHGTIGGYRTHFRHGVPMCEPCREVNRQARGHKRPVLLPCGTRAAYSRHLDHGETPCEPCRAANTDDVKRRRRLGQSKPHLDPGDSRHGTVNGYSNYGCRCRSCGQANARASADWRKAHKKEAS